MFKKLNVPQRGILIILGFLYLVAFADTNTRAIQSGVLIQKLLCLTLSATAFLMAAKDGND